MAKPSERNRMMRDIAGVAMDEELTALRRKRADLARLAVQLDDMRVFCQIFVGRFGVSFSPFERLFLGRFGFGQSCGLSVIA